jgi:N-acetylglucosaminyl-diphospho-decaprenol L-rhamnosyltransferase
MPLDLTITVVSWNTRDLLRACLRSIAEGATRTSMEVHVVDNDSADHSGAMVGAEFPAVHLMPLGENVGFARANNKSWRQARGRYWMLLNSDTEVRPGALDALVAFMDSHPNAGLATARLVSRGGAPQHCAQAVPSVARCLLEASRLHKFLPRGLRGQILLGPYWTYDRPLRLGWTWGTALIARRAAVKEAGPLSEQFFMYGEDLEWCLRMRRHGWEVWFCPAAEVLHHGGQSSALQWDEEARYRLILEGTCAALEHHRSRIYVRLLQLATLMALGGEWLTARARHRPTNRIAVLFAHHRRLLEGRHQ